MNGFNLMSPRDRVLFLLGDAGFDGVETDAVLRLAERLDERRFRRGELLQREDRAMERAHFVVTGELDFVKGSQVVRTVNSPTIIGLSAALVGTRDAPGAIRCRTAVMSLTLEAGDAFRLWESSFSLVRRLIGRQAEEVWIARDRLPFDPTDPTEPEGGETPPNQLDLIDKLAVQLSIPIFRDANLDAVAELCRQQEEIRFAPGDLLFDEGTDARFFDEIVSGVVEIRRNGEAVGAVGADNTLGLLEALATVKRGYGAVARTELVALRTDIEVLLEVLEDHFGLATRFLEHFDRLASEKLWASDGERE